MISIVILTFILLRGEWKSKTGLILVALKNIGSKELGSQEVQVLYLVLILVVKLKILKSLTELNVN